MADILYTYNEQVYANITNLCDCRCSFCIRSHVNGIGDANTLWHKKDPTLEEIKAAMDEFDFGCFSELVYCGYGEPTCALESLIESARYAKEKYGVSIRVNTNGLGNLYHNKDIVPILAGVVDFVSVSLNAPTKDEYMKVTQPRFENAFEAMQDFIIECRDIIPQVKVSIVDVLTSEQIEASKVLADELGVSLRIRKFAE
ncbi:TIGR04100 family radical SAM protein [Clostridium sp. C105KSO13]|uniref:TIGR04100 family radical SAM protein n=1 Tax=Clostridium sp. C105KSO13 TaxID=1776045 RepID=UPI00074089B4|nr:TIGR04100 family radical SAM protein [Clostridium sp. C105KSO13]CUX38083.1 molybdenum cofactor biosynthesis protein A [Clostridium sp. C105KSO13]